MHFYFMFILILYVNVFYIQGGHIDEISFEKAHDSFAFMIGIGIIYPICYDLVQVYRQGFVDYVSDKWNYVDIIYNISNIVFLIFHISKNPMDPTTKMTV